MKLGIIIPDRGDRLKFMENCFRMIRAQKMTLGSNIDVFVFVSGEPPSDDYVDITKRYRVGYDYFMGKGYDLLALLENDDFYSPDYLETMIAAWEKHKRPSLFGICYTIYYHMELKAYFTMEHHARSSAMNTFIKPDMDFAWPVDIEPFLDMHLWAGAKKNGVPTLPKDRVVFRPEKIISVGMKHGQGKTIGGGLHVIDDRVRRKYSTPDVNPEYPNGFLKTVLDAESFEFYNNYFNIILFIALCILIAR